MASKSRRELATRAVTQPQVYNQIHVVEFWVDLYADPAPGEHRGAFIGRKLMQGRVNVHVDTADVARSLGRQALRNKSRKSCDGHITVKAVAGPVEVRREPK